MKGMGRITQGYLDDIDPKYKNTTKFKQYLSSNNITDFSYKSS